MLHNQTLHQMPFLRLLFPLVIGMILSYTWNNSLIFYIGILLSASVFTLSFYLKKTYSNRWIPGMFISLFCFSCGGFLMQQTLQQTNWERSDPDLLYKGVLMEYPVEKNKTVLCKVQLLSIRDDSLCQLVDSRVILYLPKDSLSLGLLPGNEIVFRCMFDPLLPSKEKVEFDYDLYLKKQGYAAKGFVRNSQWKLSAHHPGLRTLALKCQRHLAETMQTLGLSDRSYALGVAMLLGYKDMLDTETKTTFSSSGVSHLIAISGLHVQIIFAMLSFSFAFMGNSRKSKIIRQLLILLCIWLFAFVTGLSPSVVRAASMLTFYGVGDMLGKKSLTLNLVFASAFLMLLYNPLYLFDVSFQLSYVAVLSIIIIFPLLENMHESRNPLVRYIWSLFGVSVAAQMGTVPLCLYYFHQFPTYFWIANMLVIPVVGFLLMGLVLMVAIQSFISLPSIVILPAEYILRYMIEVADIISGLPFTVFQGIYIDEIQAFLLYAMIFFIIRLMKLRVQN